MNDDLRGHPDGERWLAANRAAVVAYEEARRCRERDRAALGIILTIFGISLLLAHFLG